MRVPEGFLRQQKQSRYDIRRHARFFVLTPQESHFLLIAMCSVRVGAAGVLLPTRGALGTASSDGISRSSKTHVQHRDSSQSTEIASSRAHRQSTNTAANRSQRLRSCTCGFLRLGQESWHDAKRRREKSLGRVSRKRGLSLSSQGFQALHQEAGHTGP